MLELKMELMLLKMFKTITGKDRWYPWEVLVAILGRLPWVLDTLTSLSLATMRYVLMQLIVLLLRASDLSLKTVSVSWQKSSLRSYLMVVWMIEALTSMFKNVLEAQHWIGLRVFELSQEISPLAPLLVKMDSDEWSLKKELLIVDYDLAWSQLSLVTMYKDLAHERLLKIKQGRAPQDRV